MQLREIVFTTASLPRRQIRPLRKSDMRSDLNSGEIIRFDRDSVKRGCLPQRKFHYQGSGTPNFKRQRSKT